jgi:hypothetical protein
MSDHDLLERLGSEARARAREAERAAGSAEGTRARGSSAKVDGILAAIEAKPAVARSSHGAHAWRWGAAAASLAMAAGFALAMHAHPRDAERAPLAEYSFAVTGKVDVARAEHDETATSLERRDGSTQQVVIRPRDAVRAPIAAEVLAVRASGVTRAEVTTEISDLGVVRFDLAGDGLRDATELRVVIAPPADLASAVAAAAGSTVIAAPAVLVRIPVDVASEKK